MEAEAIPTDSVEADGGSRIFGWLRERLSSRKTPAEQAVDEAVRTNPELTSPYPKPISDAVIAGLDEGFQLGTGEILRDEQAIGFADERRPVMILVGDPITPNLTVYRLEVQQEGYRYQEMELVVAGTHEDRQLLKAGIWIEEHVPGHQRTVVTERERPMDAVELARLAGDLDGRVRDGTFTEVQRTWDVRR